MMIIYGVLGFLFVWSIGLYALVNLYGFMLDKIARRKFDKLPRGQQKDTPAESKRKDLLQVVTTGLQDERLIPISRNEPELDENGEQKLDNNNKKLTKKVYLLEKYDDYGIPLDPGKGALTLRKLYIVLLLAASIISGIGLAFYWLLIVVGGIIAFTNMGIIISNGKEAIKNHKAINDTLLDIARQRLGADPSQPKESIFSIQEWEYEGEAQTLSDAITKAGEDGKSQEIQDHIPKPGKPKPRIARFRTVPSKMMFNFPTSFMESSETAFLKHMNQNVGGKKVDWVAEKEEVQKDGSIVKKDGWDFTNKQVFIKTMPPLPQKAKLPKDIWDGPWNAIRLGRTVSGEAIWDLSGQGDSMGNDASGNPLPQKIKLSGSGLGVTTPMGLVPLDVNTEVWVQTIKTNIENNDDISRKETDNEI
jgi:hypothetical protein